MTYTTGTITSATPAKDLMAVIKSTAISAGLTFVESYQGPANFQWNSIAYGNGVFVAVGNGGVCASSPDGVTWTYHAMPDALNYGGIAYGNSMFVAVATGATCLTSPDGITWTQRPMPANLSWTAVTYGGSQFVAIASGSNAAATSPDGVTWTARTISANTLWSSVTYGNSIYVAVSSSSTTTASSSPDGVTWTSRTMPTSQQWFGVAYGNSVFVAVGGALTNSATSTNGTTWTARTMPTAVGGTWKAVTYGNGVFVAVGGGTTNSAATSTDGITWTARSLPSTGNWSSITYANSTFVTIKNISAAAATSSDGVTWTPQIINVSNSTQPTGEVYKSPAASNSFGSDWYLALQRPADTSAQVFYQVAENYDSTTHLMSNYGGKAGNVIPVAITYANPGVPTAPDSASNYASNSFLTTTTALFSYWISVSFDRVMVGIKTTVETGFYAGLYEDLLPAGVTQFPLACAKIPVVSSTGQAIGGGNAAGSGGFTREPLVQNLPGTWLFEAAIHNSYVIGPGAPYISIGYTPMTDSGALYGNTYGLSRVLIGSGRAATSMANAVRGLLLDCVVCNATSASGDTFTAGSKNYVRVGGPTTTWGIFVDTGV